MSSQTPSYDDVVDALDHKPSKETYKAYHKRIFDYLYSLKGDEAVTTDEIISNAIDKGPKADVGKSTKESRVKEVQIIDQNLSKKIIDKCPPGRILLQKAEKQIGASISSENLNKVQRECMAIANEAEQRFHQFYLDEYQSRAKGGLSVTMDGKIDADIVEYLLERYSHIVKDDFPARHESMANSITASGGAANELIGVRVLSGAGLVRNPKNKGGEFTRVGGNSNEDIIVYSNKASAIEIEVKSSKARERTARAISDMNDPTAIFAFFDDSNEVRNQIISGTSRGSAWPENSVAAYIPPETIQGVKELDKQASDARTIHTMDHPDRGKLYLRANNRFAEDMKHYNKNGELPDLDTGHHSKYL